MTLINQLLGSHKPVCSNCSEFPKKEKISKPAELSRFIRFAKEKKENKQLDELMSEHQFGSGAPIEEEPDKGPWDDLGIHTFKCPACGTAFKLVCDTYHGNGSWSAES